MPHPFLQLDVFAPAPLQGNPVTAAAQCTTPGRAGRVHVERDPAGQVWIGGEVQSRIAGTLAL